MQSDDSWKEEMAKMDKTLDKMESFAEAVRAAEALANELSCRHVETLPRDVDWSEMLGEDLEGWRAFEELECQECRRSLMVSCPGEHEHRDLEPTIEVAELPEPGEDFRCPECSHEFCVDAAMLAPSEHVTCPKCETDISEGDEFDCTCDGYINHEGPMMNYFYLVEISDVEEAVHKIAHLPLCVIEMRDGETGLALTGGGMDLSPQICEAYIALGYLPPAHFAFLPEYAGYEKDWKWIELLVCCRKSIETVVASGRRRLGYLEHMLVRIHDAAEAASDEPEGGKGTEK